MSKVDDNNISPDVGEQQGSVNTSQSGRGRGSGKNSPRSRGYGQNTGNRSQYLHQQNGYNYQSEKNNDGQYMRTQRDDRTPSERVNVNKGNSDNFENSLGNQNRINDPINNIMYLQQGNQSSNFSQQISQNFNQHRNNGNNLMNDNINIASIPNPNVQPNGQIDPNIRFPNIGPGGVYPVILGSNGQYISIPPNTVIAQTPQFYQSTSGTYIQPNQYPTFSPGTISVVNIAGNNTIRANLASSPATNNMLSSPEQNTNSASNGNLPNNNIPPLNNTSSQSQDTRDFTLRNPNGAQINIPQQNMPLTQQSIPLTQQPQLSGQYIMPRQTGQPFLMQVPQGMASNMQMQQKQIPVAHPRGSGTHSSLGQQSSYPPSYGYNNFVAYPQGSNGMNMSMANGGNMMNGVQQSQGMNMYVMHAPSGMGGGMGMGPPQMVQSHMQMPQSHPQMIPPPVPEKKKFVFKDKSGNVLDLQTLANSAKSVTTGSTSSSTSTPQTPQQNDSQNILKHEDNVDSNIAYDVSAVVDNGGVEVDVTVTGNNKAVIQNEVEVTSEESVENCEVVVLNGVTDKRHSVSDQVVVVDSDDVIEETKSHSEDTISNMSAIEIDSTLHGVDSEKAGLQGNLEEGVATVQEDVSEPVESNDSWENISDVTSSLNNAALTPSPSEDTKVSMPVLATKANPTKTTMNPKFNDRGYSTSSTRPKTALVVDEPAPALVRNKKNVKKQNLAAADLASSSAAESLQNPGGMNLDAYTMKSEKALPLPTVNVVTEVIVEPPAPVVENIVLEPADDWEKLEPENVEKIVPTVKRSLKPGGGVQPVRLNVGPHRPPPAIRYSYTNEQLRSLNAKNYDCPSQCLTYKPTIERSLEQDISGKNGSPRFAYNNMQNPYVGNDSSRWGGGGRGRQGPQYGNTIIGGNYDDRGSNLAKNRARPKVPPRPRVIITDPIEKVSREVQEIVNKIAPQNFLKLISQLTDIKVTNSEILKTLVHKIFEKALKDTIFSSMYAEMCSQLEANTKYHSFWQVVHNRDTSQYFWILDTNIAFAVDLAGPFQSLEDCFDAAFADESPEFNTISARISIFDVSMISNILIYVFKHMECEELYVGWMSFDSVDTTLRSDVVYMTAESAQKAAIRKHGFRAHLVKECQDEYMASTNKTKHYAEAIRRRQQHDSEKNMFSPEEYELREAEVYEYEISIKSRKMGNIRFIGELCKKGLIKTNTMHECLDGLLFPTDKEVDEQDIELVCKLLKSVGEKISTSANDEQKIVIGKYFSKLIELSPYFHSRIRFAIDEVIALRNCGWQERRESDGPALIEDLRSKVANEENLKRMASSQQQQQQQHGNSMGKRGGRGGVGAPSSISSSPAAVGRTVVIEGRGGRGGRGIVPRPGRSDSTDQSFNRRRNADPSTFQMTYQGASTVASIIPSPSKIENEMNEEYEEGVGGESDSAPVTVSMTEEEARKKSKHLILEYINVKDEAEAQECISEIPNEYIGFLIDSILNTFLESNKVDEHNLLINLVDLATSKFQESNEAVEQTILQYEPFVMMCDTLMDCKQAPEYMGRVIGMLVRAGIVREKSLETLFAKLIAANDEDQYSAFSTQELNDAHRRFLAVLHL